MCGASPSGPAPGRPRAAGNGRRPLAAAPRGTPRRQRHRLRGDGRAQTVKTPAEACTAPGPAPRGSDAPGGGSDRALRPAPGPSAGRADPALGPAAAGHPAAAGSLPARRHRRRVRGAAPEGMSAPVRGVTAGWAGGGGSRPSIRRRRGAAVPVFRGLGTVRVSWLRPVVDNDAAVDGGIVGRRLCSGGRDGTRDAEGRGPTREAAWDCGQAPVSAGACARTCVSGIWCRSRKQRSRTPGSPGVWVVRSPGAMAHRAASRSWTVKAASSSAAAMSTTARPGAATWASLIFLMPGATCWGGRRFCGPAGIHPSEGEDLPGGGRARVRGTRWGGGGAYEQACAYSSESPAGRLNVRGLCARG